MFFLGQLASCDPFEVRNTISSSLLRWDEGARTKLKEVPY